MWTVRADLVTTSGVPVILFEASRIFYMPGEFLCSSHNSKALELLRYTLDCAEDPGNPVIAEAHERGVVIGMFLNHLPRSKGSQGAVLDEYAQAEPLEAFGQDPLA